MNDNYILEGKTPVVEPDLMRWAKWFESADRMVARTGKVSTVFLGIDHSFGGHKPMLFETMVFGGVHDGLTERYSTWDEAMAGHKSTCVLVESEE